MSLYKPERTSVVFLVSRVYFNCFTQYFIYEYHLTTNSDSWYFNQYYLILSMTVFIAQQFSYKNQLLAARTMLKMVPHETTNRIMREMKAKVFYVLLNKEVDRTLLHSPSTDVLPTNLMGHSLTFEYQLNQMSKCQQFTV